MTVLVMSRKEIDRMGILRDLAEKRLRVIVAAMMPAPATILFQLRIFIWPFRDHIPRDDLK